MSNLNDPRVLFAAERTLLAWNRTSLALIAFGFVVERAGLLLEALKPELSQSSGLIMSFWIGLAFIALGSASAIVSVKQFAGVIKTLNPEEIPDGYGTRWGIFLNLAVAILGFVLIVGLAINY